jgi:hypothetical protein
LAASEPKYISTLDSSCLSEPILSISRICPFTSRVMMGTIVAEKPTAITNLIRSQPVQL